MLANDTALVDELYPKLLLAFSYYKTKYNTSSWNLPFKVHETYDAVKESPNIPGEGNNGYSFYNAVTYLAALSCMQELAAYRGDDTTASEAQSMLTVARSSVQARMWQSNVSYYIGDTIGETVAREANGDAYTSSDGLHAQVLAYVTVSSLLFNSAQRYLLFWSTLFSLLLNTLFSSVRRELR